MTSMVCDLGGTNCRLGLIRSGKLDRATVLRYRNEDYGSLEEIVRDYRRRHDCGNLERFVIALAASGNGEAVELTNHDWVIKRSSIRQASSAKRVDFLNDFEALGHCLHNPGDLARAELLPGKRCNKPAPRIILGAGTGFNCSVWLPGGKVVSCEAGHMTLPTNSPVQEIVKAHFEKLYGRCSVERLLSGSGLFTIYSILCDDQDRGRRFNTSEEVVEAGLSGTDPAAIAACREFATALGNVAGDLAILFKAAEGVYLTGGVTRALAPLLKEEDSGFDRGFLTKGRMSEYISDIPVYLVEDDCVALLGCLIWQMDRVTDSTV